MERRPNHSAEEGLVPEFYGHLELLFDEYGMDIPPDPNTGIHLAGKSSDSTIRIIGTMYSEFIPQDRPSAESKQTPTFIIIKDTHGKEPESRLAVQSNDMVLLKGDNLSTPSAEEFNEFVNAIHSATFHSKK